MIKAEKIMPCFLYNALSNFVMIDFFFILEFCRSNIHQVIVKHICCLLDYNFVFLTDLLVGFSVNAVF